jgi:tetratricopeptide (TPR) repeat protein
MADRLRPLWDFDDLDASEQRFRVQLERESSGEGRAEVLTQLARVEGLRGRFGEGEQLLQEAEAIAGSSPAVGARIRLERGRLHRSSGDEVASRPLFEAAFAVSQEAGEQFLAADAAHMAALVAPDRPEMLAWTQRGIGVARESNDPSVRYWLGPLLNNLGWSFYEAGDYEPALDAFRRALEERERFPEQRAEIEIARYAVGKTLRALGRPGEAAAVLEQAVSWAQGDGRPDAWFHEELAEDYAALGREAEAREQARLAVGLLEADGSLEGDAGRADRLRRLAGETSSS